MKALKASICVAVTALALSLAPGAPSCAAEDEAGVLSQQMKELYRVGKYQEALPLAQKSLAIREQEFGPDDDKVAMPLNDLGTIHYNLGQYAVAEQLYKRSLAIREKTLGPDNAEVAMVLNNLGDLYRAEERYALGGADSQALARHSRENLRPKRSVDRDAVEQPRRSLQQYGSLRPVPAAVRARACYPR